MRYGCIIGDVNRPLWNCSDLVGTGRHVAEGAIERYVVKQRGRT